VDPRTRRTRESLTRHALALIAERGFASVTAADVAAAAGVHERTFFRHFATKDEVVRAALIAQDQPFLAALRARPDAESEVEAVRCAVAAEWDADAAGELRSLAENMRSASMARQLLDHHQRYLVQELIRWIALRRARPPGDLGVQVAASVLVAARTVVVERWLADPGLDLPEAAARALSLIDAGLRLDPAASTRCDQHSAV
jgi:AcrR family transcriptional regulator